MGFARRVNQVLHDEHVAAIALMQQLGQLIARSRGSDMPDARDPAVRKLLNDLSTSLSGEVERHFAFEEERLFTFLSAIGEEAIGAHLTEEHAVIRPLGRRITILARTAAASGFDEAGWTEFSRLGPDLSQRLIVHAQKEEMALLPLLEETLDGETDLQLFEEYSATM